MTFTVLHSPRLRAAGTMILCSMLFSCSNESTAPLDQPQIVETGNAISDHLMKTLGGQLKAALEGGDPAAAVQFCAQAAAPLTEQTSTTFANATVTRTSLNYRNPKNRPDETDTSILEKWSQLVSEGKALPRHELVSVTGTTTRFYRPIMVQSLCLNCHGDPATFSPALTSVLAENYPQDLATGYVEGDLRGAFRVEIAN